MGYIFWQCDCSHKMHIFFVSFCFLALTVCVSPSAWSQGARCSVAAAHILGPRPPVKSPQLVMTFTVRHGKSPCYK